MSDVTGGVVFDPAGASLATRGGAGRAGASGHEAITEPFFHQREDGRGRCLQSRALEMIEWTNQTSVCLCVAACLHYAISLQKVAPKLVD